MKKICLATGCFYRLSEDQNEQIRLTNSLNIDGVELTFARYEEIKSFGLSEENEAYLKKLGCNSIHSPFKYTLKKDKKSKYALEYFQSLYDKIGAKNFIVHPDRVKDFSQVLKTGMRVSTENLVGYEVSKLKKVLDKHAGLGLVLDMTHAAANCIDEVAELYGLFHERITEVHCSSYINGKKHQLLHKADDDFLEKVSVIKSLDVPLVIELELSKDDAETSLGKEIAFLKEWYYS